ncbi:MAG: 3-dehydroquinate dehydratase [Melioribacter sp.]|nr:3-dehydroquinate dehydratase [Melioribacter sp.]
MKIIIINGPNLNLLSRRNKSHYGDLSLNGIINLVKSHFPDVTFDFFQSNSEFEIIEKIHHAPDSHNGLIINTGGFSHSSIAIRDALEICNIPKIEVHLSNLSSRENFRKTSITASVCDGYISGFKHISYMTAVYTLLKIITEKTGNIS